MNRSRADSGDLRGLSIGLSPLSRPRTLSNDSEDPLHARPVRSLHGLNPYITRFVGQVGSKRGLPNERAVFEIENSVTVTNFRVVQRHPKRWWDYYYENPQVGLDVWLHDITTVCVDKDPFPLYYLVPGMLLIAAAILGLSFKDLEEEIMGDETKIGIKASQFIMYLLGAVLLIAGQLSRRVCIVIGVRDVMTNIHGGHLFEIPLRRGDVWRVHDCVDTIRLMQRDFIARQQRGHVGESGLEHKRYDKTSSNEGDFELRQMPLPITLGDRMELVRRPGKKPVVRRTDNPAQGRDEVSESSWQEASTHEHMTATTDADYVSAEEDSDNEFSDVQVDLKTAR